MCGPLTEYLVDIKKNLQKVFPYMYLSIVELKLLTCNLSSNQRDNI